MLIQGNLYILTSLCWAKTQHQNSKEQTMTILFRHSCHPVCVAPNDEHHKHRESSLQSVIIHIYRCPSNHSFQWRPFHESKITSRCLHSFNMEHLLLLTSRNTNNYHKTTSGYPHWFHSTQLGFLPHLKPQMDQPKSKGCKTLNPTLSLTLTVNLLNHLTILNFNGVGTSLGSRVAWTIPDTPFLSWKVSFFNKRPFFEKSYRMNHLVRIMLSYGNYIWLLLVSKHVIWIWNSLTTTVSQTTGSKCVHSNVLQWVKGVHSHVL
jgi:hypothetical protein